MIHQTIHDRSKKNSINENLPIISMLIPMIQSVLGSKMDLNLIGTDHKFSSPTVVRLFSPSIFDLRCFKCYASRNLQLGRMEVRRHLISQRFNVEFTQRWYRYWYLPIHSEKDKWWKEHLSSFLQRSFAVARQLLSRRFLDKDIRLSSSFEFNTLNWEPTIDARYSFIIAPILLENKTFVTLHNMQIHYHTNYYFHLWWQLVKIRCLGEKIDDQLDIGLLLNWIKTAGKGIR